MQAANLSSRSRLVGSKLVQIEVGLQVVRLVNRKVCRELFCPIEEFSLQGAHAASKSWPSIASMQAAHLSNRKAESKEAYFLQICQNVIFIGFLPF